MAKNIQQVKSVTEKKVEKKNEKTLDKNITDKLVMECKEKLLKTKMDLLNKSIRLPGTRNSYRLIHIRSIYIFGLTAGLKQNPLLSSTMTIPLL